MKLKFITQNVCAGCEQLELYLKNEHPGVEFELLNVDDDRDLIAELDIMGTPTLIVWDEEEDEEFLRHVGFDPSEDGDAVDELIDYVE